jgi:hypothetical protein
MEDQYTVLHDAERTKTKQEKKQTKPKNKTQQTKQATAAS